MSISQVRSAGLTSVSSSKQTVAERVLPLLGELFPEPAGATAALAGARRWGFLLIQVAAVAAGTGVALARFSGTPPWHLIYAEDLGIYLPGALAHPGQLLQHYAGYLQLVPRLIGQVVALLPIGDAAVGFAVGGAIVASGSALFAYHASAGHISSRWLRALAGLSILVLPVAQLELADNGLCTPWYLLIALFWAILWRPSTRAGVWVAGQPRPAALTATAASHHLQLRSPPPLNHRLSSEPLPWRKPRHSAHADPEVPQGLGSGFRQIRTINRSFPCPVDRTTTVSPR